MKLFIQKISTIQLHAAFLKMKDSLMMIVRRMIVFLNIVKLRLKTRISQLNKKQRIGFAFVLGFLVVLIMMLTAHHLMTAAISTQDKAIHFETQAVRLNEPSYPKVIANTADDSQLKSAFDTLKSSAYQQFDDLRSQLQAMQASLAALPSQQDMQALQQTIAQPNPDLLGRIDKLQQSMQLIVNQTAKQSWINPGLVEKYFRLAAVQGFSDGMRAIIDVDGNQTVLSVNESCPACRGWRLKTMDFTNQSAVFSKEVSKQTLYVKLQTN